MAYQKKNLTPEERSAIYRANAMKVKNRRGGRKPREGYTRPTSSVKTFDEDHEFLSRSAAAENITMSDFLHVMIFRYGLADASMKRKGQSWPELPR